ncbi:transmembrane protein, putative [Bodo saltans]|uniref:Transmembrane protein, putative n=1 Tax=Bodo saltans TaxID=75058 RepID=A0A0S4IUA2_BODSA|nr:transmembrane protein, putative [Bodo saltans]|eukprot:CUG09520.1 transmembrane protein, putative [Bodo saltans]
MTQETVSSALVSSSTVAKGTVSVLPPGTTTEMSNVSVSLWNARTTLTTRLSTTSDVVAAVPPHHDTILQTQTAIASLTYLALISTVGRGRHGSEVAATVDDSTLQRVANSSTDGDQQNDPPFSALADNPLSLSLPMRTTSAEGMSLDYAAGAAFGNLLIVLASAAVLHCLHLLQKRFRPQRGKTEQPPAPPAAGKTYSFAHNVVKLNNSPLHQPLERRILL